jgi:hypothetical protein
MSNDQSEAQAMHDKATKVLDGLLPDGAVLNAAGTGYEIPEYESSAADPGPSEEEMYAEASRAERLRSAGLPTEAICVFAVILDQDGRWVGVADAGLAGEINVERQANLPDMAAGTLCVHADAERQLAAHFTTQTLHALLQEEGAKMAAAQQEAAIRSKLSLPGEPNRAARRSH